MRYALIIEGDDLAVDQDVRQRLRFLGNRPKFFGPVQPLAGLERDLAVLDAELQAVAVELDLVAPALAARRTLDGRAELRRNERRNRIDAFRLDALRRLLSVLADAVFLACFRRLAMVGMPDCVGLAAAILRHHERLGRLALAFGDLLKAASRGNRAILLEDVVLLALLRIFVAMLDQEPVGAVAAIA